MERPGVAISSPTMIWTGLEEARTRQRRCGHGRIASAADRSVRGRRTDRRRAAAGVSQQRQLFDRLGTNRFARRAQRQTQRSSWRRPRRAYRPAWDSLRALPSPRPSRPATAWRRILEIRPDGEHADAAENRDGLIGRARPSVAGGIAMMSTRSPGKIMPETPLTRSIGMLTARIPGCKPHRQRQGTSSRSSMT